MKIFDIASFVIRFKKLLGNPVVINVITVGCITFGIKLIGFYRETLVASTFGISLLLDTFIIAVLIPSFIQNVFVGALKNIFIPNYITEQNTSKKLGEFQSIVFCMIAGIMLFFSVLTYFASDFFIETVFPSKSSAFYNLVRRQLIIILPSLLFMGFSSVISGLLQIKDKFLSSTLIGVIPAISTIIALLFLKEELGEMVLAYGFLIGVTLPFLFLLALGYKHKVIHIKKPKFNDNSRVMLRQLPAKLTSGFLTGINPFVDQYFAAQLAVGSIAAINYGLKIPAFTSSIILIALGTVILPYFSKLINEDLIKGYHHLFKMLKMLLLATAIVTLVLIFFSNEIVSFLFERGKFSSENSRLVAGIQQILLIYIPFRICGNLMVKFLTSINKNKFMAYMSVLGLFLNILFNVIFIEKYGLYGLVLSTTFVIILKASSYFIYIRKLYSEAKLSHP